MKAFSFLILIFCLISCNKMFEENEIEQGYVRGKVIEPLISTEGINVRHFNYYSGLAPVMNEPNTFNVGNKFFARLEVGEYNLLAYTLANNKIKNSEDITTIQIYSDTVYSQYWHTFIIKGEQPLSYYGTARVNVLREDTVPATFSMNPLTKRIRCNVLVKGMNPNLKIEKLLGCLDGVIFEKKIFTNQPVAASRAAKAIEFNQLEHNKFTSTFNVFGLSENDNKLKLECIGEDFRKTTQIDLSDLIIKFSDNGIDIDVTIEIGEDMDISSITIEDWKDQNQGEINF